MKKSKSQKTETSLKARAGIKFKPDSVFGQKLTEFHLKIDEDSCTTQLAEESDKEVELVIGLDLGTSTTKVVIGDPVHKRFYAVRFSQLPSNPYLVSTAILIDNKNTVTIDSGDDPQILHDIKLNLMQKEENRNNINIIHVAAYIAQIVRYSIRWFLSAQVDEYCDRKIIWTMALGLPADSARQTELEHRFRLAAITGAQVAISKEASIAIDKLDELMDRVEEDLANISSNGVSSCFKELGGGDVVVVPEIAAQVVPLYRSHRWDAGRPISFLMDIGAHTVDSAVFSLVDLKQEDKSKYLVFCCFSCNVSELGIINLHRERMDWLIKNLPEDLPDREGVIKFLNSQKRIDGASSPVPGSIDDYINHIEIVRGEINQDPNPDPDEKYRAQLAEKVSDRVLQKAKRDNNEGARVWRNLRTMICGGGARSSFYKQFVQNISENKSNTFYLQVEPLEKPDNLEAPGLPSSEYDRLSVAYGLAQGTLWKYRWPDSIEPIDDSKRDHPAETYISKDMV